MYHGASDEARQDGSWRTLFVEYPLRYVLNMGVILQSLFLIGGVQLIFLQGETFLRLCGLYELPQSVVYTGCSPPYQILEKLSAIAEVHPLGHYSYVPDIALSALPFGGQNLDEGFRDYLSLGGVGCSLAFLACLLGSYAGKCISIY